MFKDLDIFLRAASAILQGSDPYSIPNLEVFYPLPFYFLFIPLLAIPAPIVYALWSLLSAVIFIALLRRRAVFVVFAMPVVLTFLLGQVDLVMLGLYAAVRSTAAAGAALAFIALKPQLALLIAPWCAWRWWQNHRRQLAAFILVLGAITALSFVVQPDWLVRFLARSGERTRAAISSSLWGLTSFLPAELWLPLSAILVMLVVLWAWRKNNFTVVAATGLLVSPFIFSYNLTPLLVFVHRRSVLIGLTILSWATFAIAAWQSNDTAATFITLAILGALWWEQRR